MVGLEVTEWRGEGLSPAEDRSEERLRPGERLLVVVELDIVEIDQDDVEAEGEIAVGALQERELGAPAVEVPLEPQNVLAELAGVEVVGRVPGRRPIGGGAHIQPQIELLPASGSGGARPRNRRRGARPGTRKPDRE